MEILNAEMPASGGSAQPVEIPQSVSTHASGAWPRVNLQQVSSYETDLVRDTYSVGGSNIVTWREQGVRTWLPTYHDKYSNPDEHLETLFQAMSQICKLYNSPSTMTFEHLGIHHKVKQFGLDVMGSPAPSDPIWKHRNHEAYVQKLTEFAKRSENFRPIPDLDLKDWDGPMERTSVLDFIANNPDAVPAQNFDRSSYGEGAYSVGEISRRFVNNRFTTALVLDTPRKTVSAWKFFCLVHRGFPWFKALPQFEELWSNFKPMIQVRSVYEVFTSFMSRMPSIKQVLKSPYDSMAAGDLSAYTDELTYDPPMFDIGNTILNIAMPVSEHVSNMIRSHIKVESIPYMETSTLLMQMTKLKTTQASSLSAFTATLNNSAANQAFEPVVNALACGFTKINLDIPSNSRQATVMMVVSLMTYTSTIYDNYTKALIHNMFVGMVMPTNVGAYMDRAQKEATIDFILIRKMSSEHKLLPTPPPLSLAGNAGRRIGPALLVRDAMIRLLAHFHGIHFNLPDEGTASLCLSPESERVWAVNTPAARRGFPGFAGTDFDVTSPSYLATYLSGWGEIPQPYITPNTYLHDLITPGMEVAKTVISSTFDHIIDEDETSASSILSADTPDLDFEDCEVWSATMHGMDVKVLGKYNQGRKQWILVSLVKDSPYASGFKDDVQVLSDVYVSGDVNDLSALTEPPGTLYSKVYFVEPKEVMVKKKDDAFIREKKVVKLRPRLQSILPQRGMASRDSMDSELLRKYIGEVIQPILDGVQTTGEMKYVDQLGTVMFNQRWGMLMDYITESASITMLTDYSPFGYRPLIVSSSHTLNTRDPYESRKPDSVSATLSPIRVHDAGPVYPKYMGLFEDAAVDADGNPNEIDPYTAVFMYENEPRHKTITLDPSCLVALGLLGVAPTDSPDLSGSISLNLDSKAFNHDVSIMKLSASLFMELYDPDVHRQLNIFETASAEFKMLKYKAVLSKMRQIFPTVSSLTSSVEASLEKYDLRQNQFWRNSPFIDADIPDDLANVVDPLGSCQLPFLWHRPITPMNESNSRFTSSLGKSDTLFYQMRDVITPYIEHSLSTIDRFTDVVKYNDSRPDNNSAKSRTYGDDVPDPIGLPYIPPMYFDSPLLQCYWQYNPVPDVPKYNFAENIAGTPEQPGMSPSRPHSLIFSEWLFKARKNSNKTLTDFCIVNDHGFKLNWKRAPSIDTVTPSVPIPEASGYDFPTIPIDLYYTSPDMYTGQRQAIMDLTGKPLLYVPHIESNQGPFISRLSPREYNWPANCDYTQKGALTENIYSETDRVNDENSSEFNYNLVGVIPTRMTPINFIDPTSTLVLIRDPLATAFRL